MTPSRRLSLVRLAAAGLHHSGALAPLTRAVGHVRRTPAFPILSYHRVNDDADPFFRALPTAVFERQMRHVARNYRVLPVEELVERLERGGLPRNALAITFDDGYRDNLTHAAPILSRLGLPATIFLATGFVGTAEVPWFDRLAHGLKRSVATSVGTPWGEYFDLADVPARLCAMGRALEHLKRVPDEERHRQLEALLVALGVTDQRSFKNLMLSWDDVHALRGLGFTVGAHTVNHPILSRVSPQRAWTEILGARTMIESACGTAPRAFAYPNGGAEDYTETVKRLVREAGFTCAVTTRFGLNTPKTNPWELRRGGPWEHHLPTFALKLAWYRLAQRD
ncbi:MAG TPA: polysaccharide deacetylase family protein [Methylomirabilota bacterium]|nr:polysaccharide deacetylase family protein [Methylomirabilota bacterium]